jgi:hypothetical protein
MEALGVAVANGFAQQAEGALPDSLNISIKTLSERLAEGMSNEFYRMRDCKNSDTAQEFLDMHGKFAKYIPGYKEEFEKIDHVR